MEKGLLFFTLSLLCLWVILDEFFGDKRLSNIALQFTPRGQGIEAVNHEEANKSKKEAIDKIEKDETLNPAEKEYKKKFWEKFFKESEVH